MFITSPAPEFELFAEKCQELLKPIYGIAYSGDEWKRTLDDHIQIDLKLTPAIIDTSFYCQFEYNQLVGINRSYIDDLLQTGTDNWKAHLNATLERFKTTGTKTHYSTLLKCI